MISLSVNKHFTLLLWIYMNIRINKILLEDMLAMLQNLKFFSENEGHFRLIFSHRKSNFVYHFEVRQRLLMRDQVLNNC